MRFLSIIRIEFVYFPHRYSVLAVSFALLSTIYLEDLKVRRAPCSTRIVMHCAWKEEVEI